MTKARESVNVFFGLFFLLIFVLFIGAVFYGYIYMIVFNSIHPNMDVIVGNPRPLYFYDIDPFCRGRVPNIVSALSQLSNETGVKFIRLDYPFAHLIGGIGYTCEDTGTFNPVAGEAEAGYEGNPFFVFTWNNIKLSDFSKGVILHETLHSMGFGHSKNPENIMYPYHTTQEGIDKDLRDFIKEEYANNPFAYLNIIPTNLLLFLLTLAYLLIPR